MTTLARLALPAATLCVLLFTVTSTTVARGIDPLPPSFPAYQLENPGDVDGFLLLNLNEDGNWSSTSTYSLIIDVSTGDVVWYEQFASNLSLQRGHLAYRDAPWFFILDDQFEVMDSVSSVGYSNDGHDFVWHEDGHFYVIGHDPEVVDMSELVYGGQPDAIVRWKVIQELDADKQVVREWHASDHFSIFDAFALDYTAPLLDVQHTNSIKVLPDGDVLLSHRTMSECTRIDWDTGEIVWRFGGPNATHQDFQFVGNDRGFDYQHDVRYYPESDTWTLYDNGDYHTPPYSSSVEFALDEDTMTATELVRHQVSGGVYFGIGGGVQRLPNGNHLVCWGGHPSSVHPVLTELTPGGDVVLQMHATSPDPVYRSYRAYRTTDWTFGQGVRPSLIADVDSTAQTVTLTYPVFGALEWESFQVECDGDVIAETPGHQLLLTSVEEGTHSYRVRAFREGQHSPWSDPATVTVEWNSVDDPVRPMKQDLPTVYPNPFNGSTTVSWEMDRPGKVELRVVDILGRTVRRDVIDGHRGTNRHALSLTDEPSGVYLVTLDSRTIRVHLVR